MTDEYIEARKRYVQGIRDSFSDEDTGRAATHARLHADAIREHAEDLEDTGTVTFGKLKLIIAIMLFATFVVCDRTDTKLFSMSTSAIVEKVSENQQLPPQVETALQEILAQIK